MTPLSATDLEVDLLIFILSTVLGQELIRHVSRLLHTPLMSLTNAISSVSFIAALIVLSEPGSAFVEIMAGVAVALAATNIVSGFLITDRILKLFRKKPRK